MADKIAVIVNANARKVRKGLYDERMLAHVFPEAEYFKTHTLEELDQVLKLIKRNNYPLVVGLGGDGTHHVIVTEIVRLWGEDGKYPLYLVLRGGTMNLAANNIPVRLNPVSTMKNLRTLLEKSGGLAELTRENLRKTPLLKVTNSETGQVEYGFAIGFGAAYTISDAYYASGEPSVQQAFNVTTSAIGAFVMGGKQGKQLLGHHRGHFIIDGHEYPYKTYLIAVASVFPKMVLWFKPFYARDGMWKHGFYFLCFSESTWEAVKNIRALSLGRMILKKSYNDLAEKVEAETESGYTFDGELFKPSGPYRVTIELGPVFQLLRV